MAVKNPWSIGNVSDIQFELRKRKRVRQDFWSIKYNINTGQIVSIEAGNKLLPDHIVVSYARVKDILAGKLNQNDYRVTFNEKLGALDLVDIKRPTEFKKKHVWVGWLSAGESNLNIFSPLRVILFADTGIMRVEASREWSTSLRETMNSRTDVETVPFFISDMGDNPTAGGAVDVTWTLNEILARKEFKTTKGPSLIYASIPGPEFVTKAMEAGVGGKVDVYAGAAIDARYAPPIRLSGTIESIVHGDEHAETEVLVKMGSVHVIVTKKRKPYHYEADFTRLGLDPRNTDIVVVKIGYLVP